MPFTDHFTLEPETRKRMGFIPLGLTGIYLGTNMMIMIILSLIELKQHLSKKKKLKKSKIND